MYKTFIAGITAASLTFTSAAPAQANSFNEEDFGKFLLGLMAVAGIAHVIEQKQNARPRAEAAIRDHTPKPRIPRHPDRPRHNGYGNNPYSVEQHNTVRVPRRCVDRVETRYGQQRIVDRRCIRRTTNLLNQMPRRCRVRLFTNDGARGGWDPRCLRENGIRISRRR